MSNKNDNMKKKIATGILVGASITGIASSAVLAANTSTTLDNEVANTVMDSASTTKGRSKRSDVADRESLKESPAKPPKKLLQTKSIFKRYVFKHNGPGDSQPNLKANRFQHYLVGGYTNGYYGYVTDVDNTEFKVFVDLFTADGKLYYADKNGNIKTGLQKVGDYLYYFGKSQTDAYARRGWVNIDKDSYYFDDNGRAVTGFRKIEGYDFYFGTDGKRVHDLLISPDGSLYYFKNGKQGFGLQTVGGKQFYFDEHDGGRAVKGGSREVKGVNYTFGKDGICTGISKVL